MGEKLLCIVNMLSNHLLHIKKVITFHLTNTLTQTYILLRLFKISEKCNDSCLSENTSQHIKNIMRNKKLFIEKHLIDETTLNYQFQNIYNEIINMRKSQNLIDTQKPEGEIISHKDKLQVFITFNAQCSICGYCHLVCINPKTKKGYNVYFCVSQ